MHYSVVVEGVFLERPNRFIAKVMIDGITVSAHVKNTGRCRELLISGVTVYLEDHGKNANRKTRYSLIAVMKGDMLVNMDTQVPNQVVAEALMAGLLSEIAVSPFVKREAKYNSSRFDIYFEDGDKKGFVEVKGVTLENDGTAMFPDAPTERGAKHLLELIKAKEEGYDANVFFLVQMKGPTSFTANSQMDPNFAEALEEARLNGVNIWVYDSIVTPNSIDLGKRIGSP
ncbi:MAG: DNA/RNA nuclease SfsA [Gudongella sp.]|jgi:sugar fermentation stimulation protein A|nr:DNA/RNA nuclease SfsA [Gudongella sp.]